MQKEDISVELVSCLIREQFPQWAELPIRPVELDGWDNTTMRLGGDMSVRLPSGESYVAQVDKEFGRHTFVWDGLGANGQPVAPGAYTFQVNAVNADEQPIGVKLSTRNTVDGVESDETGTFLTSGILSIPLDKVFATFATPVQSADAGT